MAKRISTMERADRIYNQLLILRGSIMKMIDEDLPRQARLLELLERIINAQTGTLHLIRSNPRIFGSQDIPEDLADLVRQRLLDIEETRASRK